jgi:hypothetical protein
MSSDAAFARHRHSAAALGKPVAMTGAQSPPPGVNAIQLSGRWRAMMGRGDTVRVFPARVGLDAVLAPFQSEARRRG